MPAARALITRTVLLAIARLPTWNPAAAVAGNLSARAGGLLTEFSDDDIRNSAAYLAGPQQAPRPAPPTRGDHD